METLPRPISCRRAPSGFEENLTAGIPPTSRFIILGNVSLRTMFLFVSNAFQRGRLCNRLQCLSVEEISVGKPPACVAGIAGAEKKRARTGTYAPRNLAATGHLEQDLRKVLRSQRRPERCAAPRRNRPRQHVLAHGLSFGRRNFGLHRPHS